VWLNRIVQGGSKGLIACVCAYLLWAYPPDCLHSRLEDAVSSGSVYLGLRCQATSPDYTMYVRNRRCDASPHGSALPGACILHSFLPSSQVLTFCPTAPPTIQRVFLGFPLLVSRLARLPMRLINVATLKLEEFFHESIPPYAILSHTWGNDKDEISFRDIEEEKIKQAGHWPIKLDGFCKRAKRDGLGYGWVDTCCIDKANSVELGEAINSMFLWYRNASICYVYLSDVPAGDPFSDPSSKFFSSRWFQRGWTLQELLAPKRVYFYDSEWRQIGTKAKMSSMVEKITGIPRPFLLGIAALNEASIAQRMAWASKRVTKRKEDIAYCLLGIFGVNMPMIYGEGDRAFSRLQQEIMRNSRDDSILAWGLSLAESIIDGSMSMMSAGVMASSPSDFANCGHIVSREHETNSISAFSIVGGFLQINLSLFTSPSGEISGLLKCGPERNLEQVVGIPLVFTTSGKTSGQYVRPHGRNSALLPNTKSEASTQTIYIQTARQSKNATANSRRNWFYIDEFHETGLDLIEVEPPDRWKDDAMIATAIESSDILQRTWIRFRPQGNGFRDFLVLLEFETQGSQAHARCSIMIVSKTTSLEDLASKFIHMRQAPFRKQSATDNMLSISVAVEQETIAGQQMFLVRLAKTNGLADFTVDATNELQLLESKLELVQLAREKDTRHFESEKLSQIAVEINSELLTEIRTLTQIEKKIRKLKDERAVSIATVDRLRQERDTIDAAEKYLKEKQTQLSIEILHAQAGLDGLLAFDFHTEKELENEYEPVIKLLMEKGGVRNDLHAGTDQTPLSWASANGYLEVVKVLLRAGNVNVGTTPTDRRTPLWWAAVKGHEEVVELLLASDRVDPDSKDENGRTPLSWAAENNRRAVVELLLASDRVRLDSKDKRGRTALSWAEGNGYLATAERLRQHETGQYPL
jgi:hypothetical protein